MNFELKQNKNVSQQLSQEDLDKIKAVSTEVKKQLILTVINQIGEERKKDPVWAEIDSIVTKENIPGVHPSAMEYLRARKAPHYII